MWKKYWIDFLLVLVFLISIVWLVVDQIGVRQSLKDKPLEIKIESAQIETHNEILVDVSGEVVRPNVYKLDSEARIKDAIDAAGGVTSQADDDYLASSINMAARLIDGQKIFIPARGANNTQIKTVIGAFEGANVSINSASRETLELLWGVGEARAESLINGRPYTRLEEVLEKKIWPENVFLKNKEKLVL